MTRRHSRKPAEPPVRLPLAHGRGLTLVDPETAERLAGRTLAHHSGGYVWVGDALLHHFVLGKPAPGLVTDHINGDRRDNRRCNLRHVSQARNLLNRHVRRAGVAWRGVWSRRGRFRAELCAQRARRFLGDFRTALVAALWRDAAAWRFYRCPEALNFPYFVRRADLPGLLAGTGGKLFHVWFVRRRDGRLRAMTARLGVAKDSKGKALAFDPTDRDLMSAYDVRQRAYRFIPLENVLCLTCNGKKFRVVR